MAQLVATLLCILVTMSILALELFRRLIDYMLHRYMAYNILSEIDNVFFLTWHDLESLYGAIGREKLGISAMQLEPLEGQKILAIVEKVLNTSGTKSEGVKHTIIENAKQTFPTTFDCYKYSACGRAIISAIVAYVLAFGSLEGQGVMGATTAIVSTLVLGLILLFTGIELLIALFATFKIIANPNIIKSIIWVIKRLSEINKTLHSQEVLSN